MLIAIYLFITRHLVPNVGTWLNGLNEFVDYSMAIVIALAGIVILFGAAGFRISQNLGSTVVNGIFHAIGYVVVLLVRLISWFATNCVHLVVTSFRGSRNAFYRAGINTIVSNLLALIITIIVLVLII